MQPDLLIKNGTLAIQHPKSKNWKLEKLDILIQGKKIIDIGSFSSTKAKKTLDAKHLHISPGFIDTQVHFRTPGLDYKEGFKNGSLGAVLGGITSVLDMPNTKPSTTDETSFNQKLATIKGQSFCNYGLFLGATAENSMHLKKLEQLKHCCGIKIFMGSSTGDLLLDDERYLNQVLQNGKKTVAIHAEDEQRLKQRKNLIPKDQLTPLHHPYLRDEQTALIATKRIVTLAIKNKRSIHILHISTKEELLFIKAVQKKYPKLITLEATPQHLTLNSPDCYKQFGSIAQMNPPIRDKKHQDALWKAIQNDQIYIIGSDHAPHSISEKQEKYPSSPSGIPGVQTSIPLLLNAINQKKMSFLKLVQLMSFHPSLRYNIQNKGLLFPGFDADLSLVDLKKENRLSEKFLVSLAPSPFVNKNIKGWPVHTIINGSIIVQNNQLVDQTPHGEALHF
ncbi:MAG: dihydroorotase [Bdellovibrionaceae bacterium]|nr:dihydroorotase [Pseudobdellovibrionaceae bacterium]